MRYVFGFLCVCALGAMPMFGCGEGGAVPCYSPAAPDGAYDIGAQGCACDTPEGRSICVGRAALECQDGKWQSFEDGPCLPRVDACVETLADADSCLAAFKSCTENGDGTFCGRSPI